MMEKAALPGAVFVCGLVLTRLFWLKTRDKKPKRAFNSATLRVAPANPAFRHKKTADGNQRSDLLLAPFVGNRLYVKSLAGGMASAARRQPLKKKGEKKKANSGGTDVVGRSGVFPVAVKTFLSVDNVYYTQKKSFVKSFYTNN